MDQSFSSDLVAAATAGLRDGVVAQLDPTAVEAGAPPQILAFDRVDATAAVWLLARGPDGQLGGYSLLLVQDRNGAWAGPGYIAGSPWFPAATRRPAEAWKEWGPVLGLSVRGSAPAVSAPAVSASAAPDAGRPKSGWRWVHGIAARRFAAVEVSASGATRRGQVHDASGAFLVMLRTRWREPLTVTGITAAGERLPVQ